MTSGDAGAGEPTRRAECERINRLLIEAEESGPSRELTAADWEAIRAGVRRRHLDWLLARVTPENKHGEWDTGPPVGGEIR